MSNTNRSAHYPPNVPETETTDNPAQIGTNSQSESIDKPPWVFDSTLREKVATEDSKFSPDSSGQNETAQPNSTVAEPVQEFVNAVPTKAVSLFLATCACAATGPGRGNKEKVCHTQTAKVIGNKLILALKQANSSCVPSLGSRAVRPFISLKGKDVSLRFAQGQVRGKKTQPEAPLTIPKIGTKTSSLKGKTPVAGEKPAIADKSEIQNPKRQTKGVRGGKFKIQNLKDVPVSPKKSSLIPEKSTDNPTQIGNKSGQISSESFTGSAKGHTGDTSGQSATKDLNPGHSPQQVVADNVKNSVASSGNPDEKHRGQFVSRNPSTVIGQTSHDKSALISKASDNASVPMKDTGTGIKEQVQDFISRSLSGPSGSQRLTIRLNPPELGRIAIKFREHAGQITGVLEVNKAQTRSEIENALPEIIRNLTDSGVQLKRLEVVLTDQSQPRQDGFKDQSIPTDRDGQQGHAGRQGFSADRQDSNNPGSQGDNPGWFGSGVRLFNSDNHFGSTQPHMQFTDNSINILV